MKELSKSERIFSILSLIFTIIYLLIETLRMTGIFNVGILLRSVLIILVFLFTSIATFKKNKIISISCLLITGYYAYALFEMFRMVSSYN